MDRVGELHLLRREIAVRVLAQHRREDEQAAERRPELVRHVREELGLVLRGQRKLFRFVLDRGARQFDFAILALDFLVLLREECPLLLQLLVGLLQLFLLLLQLLIGLLQLFLLLPKPFLGCLERSGLLLQPRVGLGQLMLARRELVGERLRLLQQLLRPHRGGNRVEHDADALGELVQKRQLDLRETIERGELDDRFDVTLEQHRQHDDVERSGFAEARGNLNVVARHVHEDDRLALERALSDEPFPGLEMVREVLAFGVRVAREQRQVGVAVAFDVEHAVLRVHDGRELGEDRARDGGEIALPLQQPREPGDVRLEPILRRVLVGRVAQLSNHFIDVVLEGRDLAERFHVDRAGQVALGDCSGNVRDRPDLCGEVRRQPVHVVDEVQPRAGRAGHACLSAELAFDPDLARNRRHLVGKGRERVDHVVDRFSELLDLTSGFEHQLAPEIPVGHIGDDSGDAAHLVREVVRHEVDVVGEVLPRSARALDNRLATELPFRADLARHTRDFRGERAELIDHRVDRVLELEDLALDVDRDLLRQVAVGDRRRDRGDVPHLAGQVRCHEVDRVGQVLPGAGRAADVGLATQLPVGADLPRDTRDLRRKPVELIDHRVDRLLHLQNLAADIDGDLLREVAMRDRGRHLRDVADLGRQVARHRIDVVGQVFPGAGDAPDLSLSAELAFRPDLAGDARYFRRERRELVDHRVHDFRRPQELPGQRPSLELECHRLRQVALRHVADDPRDLRGRLHEVSDKRVQRVDRLCPAAPGAGQRCALAHIAALADDGADALDLGSEPLVLIDDLVEGVVDLRGGTAPIGRHTRGEIAALVLCQDVEHPVRINALCRVEGSGHGDPCFEKVFDVTGFPRWMSRPPGAGRQPPCRPT